MAEEVKMEEKKKEGKSNKKEVVRAIKFAIVSASAGIVEAVVFTLMNELGNFPYAVNYLTALIASIIWCYTVNRKYTFKSDKPMKTVLLYAAAFYAVFTPATTLLGSWLTGTLGWNEYIATAINMALNLSLEYLYDTFVVYRNNMDNNKVAQKEAEKQAQKEEKK